MYSTSMKESKDSIMKEIDELMPEPLSRDEEDLSNHFLPRNDLKNERKTATHKHSFESFTMGLEGVTVEYFPYASQGLDTLPIIKGIGKRQEHDILTTVKRMLMNKRGELDIKFDRILDFFEKSKLLIPGFIKDLVPTKAIKHVRNLTLNLPSALPGWAESFKNINLKQIGIDALCSFIFGFVDGFLFECIEHIGNEKIKRWAQSCLKVIKVMLTLVTLLLIIASCFSIATFSWPALLSILVASVIGMLVSFLTWRLGAWIGSTLAYGFIIVFDWIIPDKWKSNMSSLALSAINSIEAFYRFVTSFFWEQDIPAIVNNLPEEAILTTQEIAVQPVIEKTFDETLDSIRQRCRSIRYRSEIPLAGQRVHESQANCVNETSHMYWKGDACLLCLMEKPLAVGVHVDSNIELQFCKTCFEDKSNSVIEGAIVNSLNIDIRDIDFFLVTCPRLCKMRTCFKFTKCCGDHCDQAANVLLSNEAEKTLDFGDYCEIHQTIPNGIQKIPFL